MPEMLSLRLPGRHEMRSIPPPTPLHDLDQQVSTPPTSPETKEPITASNATTNVATGGERNGEHTFLTVHEVAKLLQVPVSWVYGRLRTRQGDRLPGYRVGKYWRFREPEIVNWVKSHGHGSRSA